MKRESGQHLFLFCKRIWIKHELVGEWVKFPTTSEELQIVFERISVILLKSKINS